MTQEPYSGQFPKLMHTQLDFKIYTMCKFHESRFPIGYERGYTTSRFTLPSGNSSRPHHPRRSVRIRPAACPRPRQPGRVVKAKDLKSFGVPPHRFEPCGCRPSFLRFFIFLLLRHHRPQIISGGSTSTLGPPARPTAMPFGFPPLPNDFTTSSVTALIA